MDDSYGLYTLSDPRTQLVRYVGQSVTPRRRLTGHIRDARQGKHGHVCNWIRTLLAQELTPQLNVTAWLSADEIDAAEIELIARLRAEGVPLTNVLPGGQGVFRTMPRRICEWCGVNRVNGRSIKCCSRRCARLYVGALNRYHLRPRTRVPGECVICGETCFTLNAQTCSRECHALLRGRIMRRGDHPWPKIAGELVRCERCSQDITRVWFNRHQASGCRVGVPHRYHPATAEEKAASARRGWKTRRARYAPEAIHTRHAHRWCERCHRDVVARWFTRHVESGCSDFGITKPSERVV